MQSYLSYNSAAIFISVLFLFARSLKCFGGSASVTKISISQMFDIL